MTEKEKFLMCFENEEYTKATVIATVPDCPEPELIINSKANFEGKRKYYEKAYNDELELNTFNSIRIISYKFE